VIEPKTDIASLKGVQRVWFDDKRYRTDKEPGEKSVSAAFNHEKNDSLFKTKQCDF